MKEPQTTRECDLCLGPCEGEIAYSIGFSQSAAEEWIDWQCKRLCAGCYERLQQSMVHIVRDAFRTRFDELQRSLVASIEG